MSLTRDFWEKVLVGVGVAVLTVVLNIGVREWYQPDVRYQLGGWYRSTDLAVAGVRLQNVGHADAENIIVTAALFADPLTDIATSDLTIPFEISTGGIGQKAVTGVIKRLVADEAVILYFVTKPSSPWSELQGQFIRSIKFNGGKGKTGLPVLRVWVPSLLVISVMLGVVAIPSRYFSRRQQRTFDTYFREAIQKGHSAADERASEEQIRVRVEEWHKTLPFYSRPRKDALMTCAQAAFAGIKQNPT